MTAATPRGFSRRLRDMPIGKKLLVLMMTPAAIALIVAGLGIILFDSAFFRSYLQRDIEALAHILADNTTAALSFDDPKSAEEALDALRVKTHIPVACIYRPDGVIFARYTRGGEPKACPAATHPDGIQWDRGGFVASQPIVLKGRRIGTLVLFYDLGELYERITLDGLTVLALLTAASFVGFLFASRLRTFIATPLARLVETTTQVSTTKDYRIRAPKLSGDELGVLVDTFNEMLSGIQSRDSDLSRALAARSEALSDAQRARDSLATTLASIGDAVISTDVDGRIILTNRTAGALLGWSEQEMCGKPLGEVFRVVNELTRQPEESPLQKVLRGGSFTDSNHTMLISRDGSETPINSSAAPVRDKDGTILGAVLVFRDVRARRRADETSRLLASIVESSDDAIIVHALDGTITSWNQGAERIFGYSAAEVLGQLSDIIALPGGNEMPDILDKIRRGERVEQYYALRRTRAGETINVSIAVSPLHDALGRIVGASKIARDMTVQVQAAERLARLNAELKRSNENLARSNEDLERFAFIASHDFQEPLRMIAVYSQLLFKTHKASFDDDAAAFVQNIVEGTRRIRDLLSDLLAYTEVGVRPDETVHELDLNVVLEKATQNIKTSIEESGAIIHASPLPFLRGHEGHFIPLFQNLIGNAIKYRSERTPEIRITVRHVDGQLRFSIADNGMGIDPQYHDSIFVAFKRLHGKQIPGTGIGLAICQRVVERYGGRIWVESEVGQGSTFVFTLPDQLYVERQEAFHG